MNTIPLWSALRRRLGTPPATPAKDPAEGRWTTTQSLTALPALPRQSAPRATHGASPVDSGYDSGFDSRMDSAAGAEETLRHAQARLIEQVLRGRADSSLPACTASFGPAANLRFDFRTRLVFLDLEAQRQLRVERELPLPAAGAQPEADGLVRELDEVIWDLGIAAGAYRLMDQPEDWWHTPLVWATDARITRYSRLPRYLELARLLAEGPTTPSALRRSAQLGVSDLRRFLQAGLMLNLLRWQVAGGPPDPHSDPTWSAPSLPPTRS